MANLNPGGEKAGLFARNLFVGQRIPLAHVARQVGTVRFGTDPRASARSQLQVP